MQNFLICSCKKYATCSGDHIGTKHSLTPLKKCPHCKEKWDEMILLYLLLSKIKNHEMQLFLYIKRMIIPSPPYYVIEMKSFTEFKREIYTNKNNYFITWEERKHMKEELFNIWKNGPAKNRINILGEIKDKNPVSRHVRDIVHKKHPETTIDNIYVYHDNTFMGLPNTNDCEPLLFSKEEPTIGWQLPCWIQIIRDEYGCAKKCNGGKIIIKP